MKILIATDGSEYSRAAVEECCRLSIHPGKTEILVVSAIEDNYPIVAEPFAVSATYYEKFVDGLQELAEGFVNDAKKVIDERFPAGECIVSTEVLHGSPAQQITEKARGWNADLIVVGSHGRGFWGRLLGSVSDGVVHHAECSVLVVRKPNM